MEQSTAQKNELKPSIPSSVYKESKIASVERTVSAVPDNNALQAKLADPTDPKSNSQVSTDEDDDTEYPNIRVAAVILLALYLAMFLVALDRTIIATAIPRITDEFHSIGDVGWYASAYLVTGCGLQLIYGKIYTYYSTKWVLITAVGLFEVGSAICGAAPSSVAFILGRAVAGMGGSGIFTGALVSVVHIVPLRKRPLIQGIFGSLFGICSVIGPLIGGALTDRLTWRWCFYINLPIGGFIAVVLVFILKLPAPLKVDIPIRQQLLNLDPLGNLCLIPSVVCLLLTLQWGGSVYAWGSARIVALFVLAGVLAIVFISIQIWKQDAATVPPRIAKQRSIASGMVFAFISGSSMMIVVYYLPVWFQSIKGVSPIQSGIDTIPLVMSMVVGSVSSGVVTFKTGYYTPAMILSPIIMSIGAGLLTTLKVGTSSPIWIGYQIIFGFGLGIGLQIPNLAAQCILPKIDVPTGSSLIFFTNQMGGAIFISVGENIFTNKLIVNIEQVAGLDPAAILKSGATELRTVVAPALIDAVLEAYNAAISYTFYVSVAVGALGIIPALTMEWKSIKGKGLMGRKATKEVKEVKEEL